MIVRILLLHTDSIGFTEKFNAANMWLADRIGGYDWHMKVTNDGVSAVFEPKVDKVIVTMFKLKFGI